jgi:hypothetical protein
VSPVALQKLILKWLRSANSPFVSLENDRRQHKTLKESVTPFVRVMMVVVKDKDVKVAPTPHLNVSVGLVCREVSRFRIATHFSEPFVQQLS